MSWLKERRRCFSGTGDRFPKREDTCRMILPNEVILHNELFALTGGVFQLCSHRSDLPPQAPQVCALVPLAAYTLAALRRRVREAAQAVGMSMERCDDLTQTAEIGGQ